MSTLQSKKQAILDFNGPMAAVLTPFDAEGKVDEKQIFKYAHHLARIGVKGVYILGTTGESYSLAIGEKILLVKTWRTALDEVFKETGKKIVAIVNISATCVNEIHCLATLVDSLQFDGLALLPPIYYRINNCKQLIGYINSIVGKHASTIPFLYYHIPSFTGELAFELEQFVGEALQSIPQFCSMKFTDVNIVRFGSIQSRYGSQVKIFAGFDETILATRSLGSTAAICATFSLASIVKQFNLICQSFDSGNFKEAQSGQATIALQCAKLRENGNFFASLKQQVNDELKQQSIQFGKPRPPILNED